MDVHTSRPVSSGSADPEAPDRTDPYSFKPQGTVDTGAASGSPTGSSNHGGGDDRPSPIESVKSAFTKFGELGEYLNLYIAAKTDALKATLRRVAIFAALGVVGLLALCGLVVTAIVLVCVGLAQAIGALLGGHMWAGYLIAGVLLLGLIAAGAMVGLKMIGAASRKAVVKKYELRQRDQRERFGHDAADRAAAEGKVGT